ncbi:MAG: hypothetical protein ACRDNY_00945 [Gaiellaceae bacterium]
MRRVFLALAVALLLLLVAGVGTAAANPPASQDAGQLAGSEQDAGAAAGSAQQGATNENGPVRVGSPGDDGSVSQSNEASSNATAGNLNATGQTADQTQAGGSGLQVVGQSAMNDQDAFGLAFTLQQGASNENEPVRVLSPGDSGSVVQSNDASSDASAGNVNVAKQTADQEQAGSHCCGGGGEQVIGQSADSDQDAAAFAATKQEEPSNSSISVRVLSPGDDGDVSQSNEASSNAEAGNLNVTKQDADQTQAGDSCKCGGAGEQVIGQSADSDQDAAAFAATKQEEPSNSSISVRVLSPGDGGSVEQSNVASSDATAGNINLTGQDADQTQTGGSCKCGSDGEQLIGQKADSEQDAKALSATIQEKPSNSSISVRVLSPGDDGDVTQTNEASSNATAGNLSLTHQDADQTQAGGSGLQAIGQSAKSDQDAFALGLTVQKGASNENIPVRVLSPGDSGSVSQSNVASSDATAFNLNLTGQKAEQTQAGGSCKCGSGLQAIGQSAESEQGAAAISATIQEKPSNSNAPVRVLSWGDDGEVVQTNEASSNASAGNLNLTKQAADQVQAGGSGIQAIGQSAKNEQGAFALGLTIQKGASNENAPIRVLSPGDSGSVSQSNVASSNAAAGNINWTFQQAGQIQGGRGLEGHCCGTGIQAIGQSSKNHQGAVALAATLQLGAKPPCKCKDDSEIGNSNEPTRVLSKGDDAAVRQANVATSDATATNWNVTKQAAFQLQARSCRCKGGDGIQAIGQLDESSQFALGLAASLQLDPSNEWGPDRKKSPGRNGPLSQKGKEAARDASGSATATDQSQSQVEGR